MWIRTQDRERLIKINGVGLTPSKCSIYPIGENGVLGTYKTKERALEVLDEIDERIGLINALNTTKDIETLIGFKRAIGEDKCKGLTNPYQMPKE